MLIDVADTNEVILRLKETIPEAISHRLKALKAKGEGGLTASDITTYLVNHHNPEKFGASMETWEGYTVEQILIHLQIMQSRDQVYLDQRRRWYAA